MKEIFSYLGIISLTLFSFYYTDKVVKELNQNDPIMLEIMKEEVNYSMGCNEGVIIDDKVILGVNGKSVNKIKSYNNMMGFSFDETKLVFDEIKCKVDRKTYIDKYIIKGNEVKNAVTLFIDLTNLKYLNSINEFAKENDITLTYIINKNNLDETVINSIIESGNDVVYKGNNEKELKLYLSLVKNLNNSFCISIEEDNKELCLKHKINTLKTDNYFYKNIVVNTKKVLEKGEFIVLKENELVINELDILVKFIKGKNIKIEKITEHLN